MSNEAETSVSEEETSEAMYQAMAERMKEDGMDVTSEDVKHAVDSVSEDAASAPNEKDAEVLAAMQEYQKEFLRQNPIYAVRGALLYCDCGSHCRRLNLPRSHGVYILNHAAMHAGDHVAGMEGPDLNITTFGICSVRQDGGIITLQREIERDPNTGLFLEGKESTGVIRGAPCLPIITEQWQDTHADTKIGAEQLPALTTISFLLCARGGTIGIWRSGQEDDDGKKDTLNKVGTVKKGDTSQSLTKRKKEIKRKKDILDKGIKKFVSLKENDMILFSKEYTARRDSGLRHLTDDEVSEAARKMTGKEKQRYTREDKVRSNRNVQKREEKGSKAKNKKGKKKSKDKKDDSGSKRIEKFKLNLIPIEISDEGKEFMGFTGVALVIYLIISEGSRLIPARNLLPVL